MKSFPAIGTGKIVKTDLEKRRSTDRQRNNFSAFKRKKSAYFTCTLLALFCKSLITNGAGEGNWCSLRSLTEQQAKVLPQAWRGWA
jgi:hypothetical protein